MIALGATLVGVYLVASIPFGYLVGRVAGVDVRRAGSGNIGATNVLRVRGAGAAAATLLLDVAKGAGGVAAAQALHGRGGWAGPAAALTAVIGHCYPIYLAFQGGKGVATAAGALAVLHPLAALGGAAAFAAAVGLVRMVSVGSIAGVLAYPLWAWGIGSERSALAGAAVAAVILWRHRENLARIRAGREPRIGPRRGEGAAR